jgi:hypothetical protein
MAPEAAGRGSGRDYLDCEDSSEAEVSIEELRAALAQAPASSAGMDGIPYQAYSIKPSSPENLMEGLRLQTAWPMALCSGLIPDGAMPPRASPMGALWTQSIQVPRPLGSALGPPTIMAPCRTASCRYCRMRRRPQIKEARGIAAMCLLLQARTHGWLGKDWKLTHTARNQERECALLGARSKRRAKKRKQDGSPTA